MATVAGQPPAGRVVGSLPLAEFRGPTVESTATLQVRDTGVLVLYCVDAGYPVWMQIAEDCTSWEQWFTVAADDVPRLCADRTTVLETVRDAAGIAPDRGSDQASSRFTAWLNERGVPYTWAERLNYD